jgi:Xaa-Pro aminopeptidase
MSTDNTRCYAVASALTRIRYTACNYNHVANLKGTKNEVEIVGFRAAYLRDSAASLRWLAWLEESITKKTRRIAEWEAAEKLTEFRKPLDFLSGLAYESISATGLSVASPHYSPSKTNSLPIQTSTPYDTAVFSAGTTGTRRSIFQRRHGRVRGIITRNECAGRGGRTSSTSSGSASLSRYADMPIL